MAENPGKENNHHRSKAPLPYGTVSLRPLQKLHRSPLRPTLNWSQEKSVPLQ